MNAQYMQRYLSLVGKELQEMGVQEPIQLLLIGGGYMLTQVRNRTVTGDVDAVWVSPEVSADSELYRLFEVAVQLVAEDEGLGSSWLSTDVSDFVFAAGPLPKRKLWKRFEVLHMYLPPKEFILAHKLIAAREKDEGD